MYDLDGRWKQFVFDFSSLWGSTNKQILRVAAVHTSTTVALGASIQAQIRRSLGKLLLRRRASSSSPSSSSPLSLSSSSAEGEERGVSAAAVHVGSGNAVDMTQAALIRHLTDKLQWRYDFEYTLLPQL